MVPLPQIREFPGPAKQMGIDGGQRAGHVGQTIKPLRWSGDLDCAGEKQHFEVAQEAPAQPVEMGELEDEDTKKTTANALCVIKIPIKCYY